MLDNVRELRRRLEASLDGVNKSATSRVLDENIRSQSLSEEKSVLDKSIRTFAPEDTSSPVSSRTRSKVDVKNIKSKGLYSYSKVKGQGRGEEESGHE